MSDPRTCCSPSLPADPVVRAGALRKLSAVLKTWKPRYFELHASRLCYYETAVAAAAPGARPRGSVDLSGAAVTVLASYKRPHSFEVASGETAYTLAACSRAEMLEWIDSIRKAIGSCASSSSSGPSQGPTALSRAPRQSDDEVGREIVIQLSSIWCHECEQRVRAVACAVLHGGTEAFELCRATAVLRVSTAQPQNLDSLVTGLESAGFFASIVV
eukprot:m51a1_g14420 hypothetical protein (216) ;mRNA; r:484819-485735